MKQAAVVCGTVFAILMVSCAASAQSVASDPVAFGPATFSSAASSTTQDPLVAQLDGVPAIPSFAVATAAPAAEPLPAFQKNAPPAGSGADVPPAGVYGVFPSYKWQVYVGYTSIRFYVAPGVENNTNGADFSVAYYFRDRVAVDGELAISAGTYTPQQNSEFFVGMGGLRYRHPVGQAAVWVHGLAGEAHFSPQTPYGSEDGFGYEVGGGIDVSPRRLRVSLRLEADMVGTHLYGTYQYSPKISFGLVFKD